MFKGCSASLPTFATAKFQRFFDCGRAVSCLLSLGKGRGADTDAEQLALTEELFDAALPELAVVARGSPCLLAGDFNGEPTKIPCLSKGISAGLIWMLPGLLLRVSSQLLRESVAASLLLVVAGAFW